MSHVMDMSVSWTWTIFVPWVKLIWLIPGYILIPDSETFISDPQNQNLAEMQRSRQD